jgi:hypothetical protein
MTPEELIVRLLALRDEISASIEALSSDIVGKGGLGGVGFQTSRPPEQTKSITSNPRNTPKNVSPLQHEISLILGQVPSFAGRIVSDSLSDLLDEYGSADPDVLISEARAARDWALLTPRYSEKRTKGVNPTLFYRNWLRRRREEILASGKTSPVTLSLDEIRRLTQ